MELLIASTGDVSQYLFKIRIESLRILAHREMADPSHFDRCCSLTNFISGFTTHFWIGQIVVFAVHRIQRALPSIDLVQFLTVVVIDRVVV